jgi:hypothetical protein
MIPGAEEPTDRAYAAGVRSYLPNDAPTVTIGAGAAPSRGQR